MGKHVQLLLLLALHVLGAGIAQNLVHQTGTVDVAVDDLGRQTDGRQNATEIAAGVRVLGLLLDDELAQTFHGSLLIENGINDFPYCNEETGYFL